MVLGLMLPYFTKDKLFLTGFLSHLTMFCVGVHLRSCDSKRSQVR